MGGERVAELGRTRHCGAELQRPHDRVASGLVGHDRAGHVGSHVTLRRADDVEVLAEVEFGAQPVPDRPGRFIDTAHLTVGHHHGDITDQDRGGFAEASVLAVPSASLMPLDVAGPDGGRATTGR